MNTSMESVLRHQTPAFVLLTCAFSWSLWTHFLPITLGGILLLAVFVVFIIVRDRMWRGLPVEAMHPVG